MMAVDRARFVRPADEGRAYEDVPLPLDDDGLATVSAPHMYLLSFRLVDLAAGDTLVELGSGTGYGAALASRIVGASGAVTTIEIAPSLAERAKELLGDLPNVTVHAADAIGSAPLWGAPRRVVCTFAIEAVPSDWIDALPRGAVLVAPVGPADRDQRLLRIEKMTGGARTTDHGAVRYVRNRSPSAF
jgi:protein-L-isoaspartate(D-aspartate) O-methyltransferase